MSTTHPTGRHVDVPKKSPFVPLFIRKRIDVICFEWIIYAY